MFSICVSFKQCVLLSTILLFPILSHTFTLPSKRCNAYGYSIKMVRKKRKFVSDGENVLESFAPLEGNPLDTHTLILGTLPSDKSYGQNLSSREILLRGGDGHQNYGNSRNSFWHIIGSAFGFKRHRTPFEEQVRILTNEGYAVWDVLSKAKRKGSLDANLVKGSLFPTDLPTFVLDHPNLNRFVFAANSAEVFCKQEVWADWVATGKAKVTGNGEIDGKRPCEVIVQTKFWIQGATLNNETFSRTNSIFGRKKAVETVDDLNLVRSYRSGDGRSDKNQRVIELVVVPSTSPANAIMRPPEKEKKWHIACYQLREPPEHYVCPGCAYHLRTAKMKSRKNITERHWFHDCPHREEWKIFQKAQSRKISTNDTQDDSIDPFYWYT